MATVDLPDVNVWVAMSAPEHPHHKRARAYWREESNSVIAFNPITMLGLVRVCSSAGLFSGRPLEVADAWTLYEQWMSDRAVRHAPEPESCREVFQGAIKAGQVNRKNTTDAYLASFAMAAGYRMVTFDADFALFKNLELLLL